MSASSVSGCSATGRRAIVTGSASGIGVETARALASAGAEVTLAVRDVRGLGVAVRHQPSRALRAGAWSAYGQSKTANVLFAVEASKRWAADGITANALMPGGIRTNLQRHQTGPEFQKLADAAARL